MSTYAKLDAAIIATIRHGRSPVCCSSVYNEAAKIAHLTGREEFRITDGRLQALRKAGKIRHFTKRERLDGRIGWHVAGSES